MTTERMRLRRLNDQPTGSLWLVTWDLETPVWAVIHASRNPSVAMATAVGYAAEIPWRSDESSRFNVGRAALMVERAIADTSPPVQTL